MNTLSSSSNSRSNRKRRNKGSNMFMSFVALLCLWFGKASALLNPVEIKGYKLFDSVTGDEVVLKGIDYYPRPNYGDLNHNSLDYYTEEHSHIWERDIPYMQELGVNAIRLYAVDANENHDAFMCALNAAGIYVIIALAHDCPTCAVTRDQAPDCYPKELKEQGQDVINAFAKYPNTLAFSAGNEVNHFAPPGAPEWNAPCVKKFIRDMRAYIDSCDSIRKVPVGLVSADSDREANAMYYNCYSNEDDPDEFETAEWYGLNSYVFCDGKAETYDDALGLKSLLHSFENFKYSIPVLLTEFGCLSETFPTVDGYGGQRNFLQAKWMLEEPEMLDLFSGGFAFEYSIEMENAKGESPFPFTRFGKQNYGVGYFEPEHCDDVDIPCNYQPLPSYDSLKTIYQSAVIPSKKSLKSFKVPDDRSKKATCPEAFPPLDSFTWEVDDYENKQCPSNSESHFTCPGSFQDEFQFNIGTNESFGAMMLVVLLLIVIVGIAVCVASCRFSQRQEYTKIVPTDSDDASSDESTGLLSLKNLQPDEAATRYRAVSDGSLDSKN